MAGIRLCRSGIDRIDYADVKIDKVDALRHQRVLHASDVHYATWILVAISGALGYSAAGALVFFMAQNIY